MKTFRVAKLRNSTVHYYGRQGEIFLNGTLRLDNVSKNDTGEITAKLFDENGKHILQIKYHLIVTDPVSQPIIEYTCSQGQSEFHCSVESDNPLYSWSFNNKPLLGVGIFHNVENHKLSLRNSSGRVTCTVSNNVTQNKSETLDFSCTGEDSMQVTGSGWCIGIKFSAIVLICMIASAFHIYTRKQNKQNI
ncbi:T-cell surface antigen CD2-like [Lepisosteus oculatus]|uniref:T-cell surface antigen CD2-like n=1 Tax=Lepisosteus oculatus TaxID=7918 RepID=UPI0035F50A3E